MSLKMFFDAACTQPVLTAEKFTGTGPYTLVAFTGAQLGGIYKERKDSYTDIAFTNGVGSGFVGLVVDALKGQRVVHGAQFIGQITSNTDTTITVSNITYTAAAAACYVSSYTKLYTPSDFTLAGNVITMITPTVAGETIHAVPVAALAMYFGGMAGNNVTKTTMIYIKRDANYEYTLLQVSSDDTSLFPYHQTTPDVSFAAGVGSGFAGLPVNGLAGKALNHNGVFAGLITSNTATTVTLDAVYTGPAANAEVYNVGSLTFSTDGTNFMPVLGLADLAGAAEIAAVHVKDTLNIPTVAINYPSNIIKVSGVEYIA